MLTNTEMKEGRYFRLHKARRKVAAIVNHLQAGHTVQIATHTRATNYTAKHADMFKATRSGAYVQRGKGWDCFDFATVTVFG